MRISQEPKDTDTIIQTIPSSRCKAHLLQYTLARAKYAMRIFFKEVTIINSIIYPSQKAA